MKRIILFLFCLYFSFHFRGVCQSYVIIPDTAFASYLRSVIPTAMSGNQMDTSSLPVKQLKYINASALYIASLSGIQYFYSLKGLACSNNTLTNLPDLPDSLTSLNCAGNQLINLPAMPNMLQTLWCGGNQLASLPALPNSIWDLKCGYNQLSSLPSLPTSLQTLSCEYNHLTNLPLLPNLLKGLYCKQNQLTSLPTLPNTLQVLWCSHNQLTSLPALPNSLTALMCDSNNIVCFPSFPNSLNTTPFASAGLLISDNPFTCLPNYLTGMNATLLAYPLCSLDNISGCPVSTDLPTAIIIPNVFTPNGDSINDTFFVKGANLTNFSCKIFDRWGVLLYQWTDINKGWNGKDKNGASTDGTYYYVITYTDNTGKTNNKNGFFQLLR